MTPKNFIKLAFGTIDKRSEQILLVSIFLSVSVSQFIADWLADFVQPKLFPYRYFLHIDFSSIQSYIISCPLQSSFVYLTWKIFSREILRFSTRFGRLNPDFIFRSRLRSENNLTERDLFKKKRYDSLLEIDNRIAIIRNRSNAILIAIGILLLIAAMVIIFAGYLIDLDANAANEISQINNEIQNTEYRLSRAAEASTIVKQADNAKTDKEKAEILEKIRSSDSYPTQFIPTTAEGVRALEDRLTSHLANLQKILNEAWNKELESRNNRGDGKYILASAVTRIGVVLVIVFLVQILVGLFRYNSGLVTFYSARRDIVQYWDGNIANIEAIEKLFAPQIDFGREPKHPLDDLLRQIINKMPSLSKDLPDEKKP